MTTFTYNYSSGIGMLDENANGQTMKVHSGSIRVLPGCPTHVQMSLLNEETAERNHSQSLTTLNGRGGLGVLEMLDNIHRRRLSTRNDKPEDLQELQQIIYNSLRHIQVSDPIQWVDKIGKTVTEKEFEMKDSDYVVGEKHYGIKLAHRVATQKCSTHCDWPDCTLPECVDKPRVPAEQKLDDVVGTFTFDHDKQEETYKENPNFNKPALAEQPNEGKEYILSSAIYYNDGKQYPNQPKNISIGLVVCGFGHGDCISVLALIFPDLSYKENYTEGFITSLRRYVGRKEAGELALKSGQIKELKHFGGKELDSSDLYGSNPTTTLPGSGNVEDIMELWEKKIPLPIREVLNDLAISHTYPVKGIIRNFLNELIAGASFKPPPADPYAEICDKLGNPIDALDSYLQLMKSKDSQEYKHSEEWNQCNGLIEKIKTIFHEFRSKGKSTQPPPAEGRGGEEYFSSLDGGKLTKPMSNRKEDWQQYFFNNIDSTKDRLFMFNAIWDAATTPVQAGEEADQDELYKQFFDLHSSFWTTKEALPELKQTFTLHKNK